MKKSISIIGATLFVVAITLSSCGGDEEKDKENPPSNTGNTGNIKNIDLNDVNKLIDQSQEMLNTINNMDLDNEFLLKPGRIHPKKSLFLVYGITESISWYTLRGISIDILEPLKTSPDITKLSESVC